MSFQHKRKSLFDSTGSFYTYKNGNFYKLDIGTFISCADREQRGMETVASAAGRREASLSPESSSEPAPKFRFQGPKEGNSFSRRWGDGWAARLADLRDLLQP